MQLHQYIALPAVAAALPQLGGLLANVGGVLDGNIAANILGNAALVNPQDNLIFSQLDTIFTKFSNACDGLPAGMCDHFLVGQTKNAVRRDIACMSLPKGFGPVADKDTAADFRRSSKIHSLAQSAPTPEGYRQIFKDEHAAIWTTGLLGKQVLFSYDPLTCGKHCDRTAGCQGFNVFVERDPIMMPDSKKCPDPSSSTTFKCTLWSTVFESTDATFKGTMKGAFEIAIAASNGYIRSDVFAPMDDYSAKGNSWDDDGKSSRESHGSHGSKNSTNKGHSSHDNLSVHGFKSQTSIAATHTTGLSKAKNDATAANSSATVRTTKLASSGSSGGYTSMTSEQAAATPVSDSKNLDETSLHIESSSKSRTPAVVEHVGSFDYQGCFDKVDGEPFATKSSSNHNNTLDTCAALCSQSKYFAVEGASQCHCGEKITSSLENGSEGCNKACASDSTQLCGGDEALAVYERNTDGEGFVHPTHGAGSKPAATLRSSAIMSISSIRPIVHTTSMHAHAKPTEVDLSSVTRATAQSESWSVDRLWSNASAMTNFTDGHARPTGRVGQDILSVIGLYDHRPSQVPEEQPTFASTGNEVSSSGFAAPTEAAQPPPSEVLFGHPSWTMKHGRPSSSVAAATATINDHLDSTPSMKTNVLSAEATGDSSPDFNKTKETDVLQGDAESHGDDGDEHKSFAIPLEASHARPSSFYGSHPSNQSSSAVASPTADAIIRGDEASASAADMSDVEFAEAASSSVPAPEYTSVMTHHGHGKPTDFDRLQPSSSVLPPSSAVMMDVSVPAPTGEPASDDMASKSPTQQAIPTTLSRMTRPSHTWPTDLLAFLHGRPHPVPTPAASSSQMNDAATVTFITDQATQTDVSNEQTTPDASMPVTPQEDIYPPRPSNWTVSSVTASDDSAPTSQITSDVSAPTAVPSVDVSAPSSTSTLEMSAPTTIPTLNDDPASCSTMSCPANDGATCTTALGNTIQLSCTTDYGLGNLTLTTETSYSTCAARCEAQGLTGEYGTACIGFAYFPSRDADNCYTYAHFSADGYQIKSEPFMNGMFVPYDSVDLAADESSFAYKKRRGLRGGRW